MGDAAKGSDSRRRLKSVHFHVALFRKGATTLCGFVIPLSCGQQP
jgi:hypothetical protein